MTEQIVPVRLCCGTRHWNATCPDGLVMCQICFHRVDQDELWEEDGKKWDICKQCELEERKRYG